MTLGLRVIILLTITIFFFPGNLIIPSDEHLNGA